MISILLAISSFFLNPYRCCRRYFEKRGKPHLGIYGETPIPTLEQIVRLLQLSPQDTYVELGSGRGRGCFWVKRHIGCKVIGIEKNPYFIRIAKGIQKLTKIPVEFIQNDLFQQELLEGCAIYLYGTTLLDKEVEKIVRRLPSKCRIVTISYPLKGIPLKESIEVNFPWGKTEAYLHGR